MPVLLMSFLYRTAELTSHIVGKTKNIYLDFA
jgi:hypothetical protein